jgi:hypothetical protein
MEIRKAQKKVEHTLSFFEIDTSRSLETLKATCSELRKLNGDS